MSLGGGGVIGAAVGHRHALGGGRGMVRDHRQPAVEFAEVQNRRTGPSPASTTRREPEPAQARSASIRTRTPVESMNVTAVRSRTRSLASPCSATAADSADGGEIQFAADHDRCQRVVALDGDLEGRVGLVARGHVEHLGSVGKPVGLRRHRHSASVAFHRIPDACPDARTRRDPNLSHPVPH